MASINSTWWMVLLFGNCLIATALGWGSSDKIKLTDVNELTLVQGKMTNSRRTRAIPQFRCVGGSAGCPAFNPGLVKCFNRGSDGIDVQWKCLANMDSRYCFGEIAVNCERYSYSDDPYILEGSCGLEYTIEVVDGSDDNSYHDSGHRDRGHHGYHHNYNTRSSDSWCHSIIIWGVSALIAYLLYKYNVTIPHSRLIWSLLKSFFKRPKRTSASDFDRTRISGGSNIQPTPPLSQTTSDFGRTSYSGGSDIPTPPLIQTASDFDETRFSGDSNIQPTPPLIQTASDFGRTRISGGSNIKPTPPLSQTASDFGRTRYSVASDIQPIPLSTLYALYFDEIRISGDSYMLLTHQSTCREVSDSFRTSYSGSSDIEPTPPLTLNDLDFGRTRYVVASDIQPTPQSTLYVSDFDRTRISGGSDIQPTPPLSQTASVFDETKFPRDSNILTHLSTREVSGFGGTILR